MNRVRITDENYDSPIVYSTDIRSLQAGNYMVYYRADRALIRIIRVIHGMRDQVKAWTEP